MFSFIAIKGPDTFWLGLPFWWMALPPPGRRWRLWRLFPPSAIKILRHSVRFIRVHRQFWPHQYSGQQRRVGNSARWQLGIVFVLTSLMVIPGLWILWRLRSALEAEHRQK